VRVARLAPQRSDAWRVAHRELAARMVDSHPWRASLLLRRVLRIHRWDDGSWALLGLAQSLLGNHRYAVRAYRQALRLAPNNPWYAHNLGHLYDAVLDRPLQALPLLRRSVAHVERLTQAEPLRFRGIRDEVVASYAHALLRTGDSLSARQLMREVIRGRATPTQHALYRRILEVEDDALANLADQLPVELTARRRPRKTRRTRSL
jgi:tetratricopeptide (TPR) repeat protein